MDIRNTPFWNLLMISGLASSGGLVEDSATGNPVVFETDVAKPLQKLSLSLLPRQAGSGDPSPENVRDLIPWENVGTWQGGKNIFKASSENLVYSSGGWAQRPTYTETGIIAKVPEGFGYALYYLFKVINTITRGMIGKKFSYSSTLMFHYDAFVARDSNGNISEIPNGIIREQDVGKMLTLRIYVGSESGEYVISDMQVEIGETASPYVSPTIIPHPVDLTGITPPVYGCEIDQVTGEVWGTWAYANLNSESAWGSYGTGDGFLVYVTKSDMKVGNRLSGCCDMFPSTFSDTNANIRFGANDNVIRLYHVDTLGVTDLAEWKEFIGTDGINVCYPLATPVLLATLDPKQIESLIGTNTIWTDGDNVDVTFLKKK